MSEDRVVVLASGSGTILQALLDSSLRKRIAAVGSDVAGCGALERADQADIATFVRAIGDDREAWDADLRSDLAAFSPDWVISAGFMRIIGPQVLGEFPGRIVNTHPSLLPAFPGAHAVRDALAYGVQVSGCTVHVVDAGVDTGPILAQQPVFVEPDDTEDSLHERIKEVERVLLIDVVERLIEQRITIEGRSVQLT